MKKLISLTLAALLLLNLAACGESSVSNPSGSSGDSSSSADPAQPDAFSPVTTEAEVRALYGDDASLITSIEAYQGDFLVKLGTDEDCPSLDWVYGQSGIRRRMLWLDTPLLRCEIESQASVRVVTGGPNIYNGVPGFPRVELATLSLLYDEQGRDRGYDPYVSPGIGSSEIYWAGAGERYSMGMQGRREAIRSAQVDAGGGEGCAGAGGGLLEEQRDVLALEVAVRDVLLLEVLEVLGEADEPHELVPGVVPRGEQVATLENRISHSHVSFRRFLPTPDGRPARGPLQTGQAFRSPRMGHRYL